MEILQGIIGKGGGHVGERGGANKVDRFAVSVQSMPFLGGLGACPPPPRNFLKFTYCEIEIGGNFNLKCMFILVLNNNVCDVLLLSSTCTAALQLY